MYIIPSIPRYGDTYKPFVGVTFTGSGGSGPLPPDLTLVYDEWAWDQKFVTLSSLPANSMDSWYGMYNNKILSSTSVAPARRPIIFNNSVYTNGISSAGAYTAFDGVMPNEWMVGSNARRRALIFVFETQLTQPGTTFRNFGMYSRNNAATDRGGIEVRSADGKLYMSTGGGIVTEITPIPTGMTLSSTQLLCLGIGNGNLYFNTKLVDLSTDAFVIDKYISGPSFFGSEFFNNFPMRLLGILGLYNSTDTALPVSSIENAVAYMNTKYSCPVFT